MISGLMDVLVVFLEIFGCAIMVAFFGRINDKIKNSIRFKVVLDDKNFKFFVIANIGLILIGFIFFRISIYNILSPFFEMFIKIIVTVMAIYGENIAMESFSKMFFMFLVLTLVDYFVEIRLNTFKSICLSVLVFISSATTGEILSMVYNSIIDYIGISKIVPYYEIIMVIGLVVMMLLSCNEFICFWLYFFIIIVLQNTVPLFLIPAICVWFEIGLIYIILPVIFMILLNLIVGWISGFMKKNLLKKFIVYVVACIIINCVSIKIGYTENIQSKTDNIYDEFNEYREEHPDIVEMITEYEETHPEIDFNDILYDLEIDDNSTINSSDEE